MASMSMRQVASPRSLASALISPRANHPLDAVIRQNREPWSPHSVSSLKNSPALTPHVVERASNVLSPYSEVLSSYTDRNRSNEGKPSSGTSRRFKSARKLPWSDGGKYSASLGISNLAGTTLESVSESVYCQPSVDTPERSNMLKKFEEKSSSFHVLGKGSFGTVIEALYKGKPVAVKIVQPTLEACRQLKNEINCLKLHHPNIVSMFKVALPKDGVAGVVIMERVPGHSLQTFLDQDFLKNKVQQRIKYSIQLSTALAYCHRQGVLHLDVKPLNVILDLLTDTCRLCDFGCSSKMHENFTSLKGTVGYVAPELLQGNCATTAADVYSLGITMWQMISGETPYKGQRNHVIIYKVVADEQRPQLPTVLCLQDERYLSLVKKCWLQRPESRPTVQEVLDELIAVITE